MKRFGYKYTNSSRAPSLDLSRLCFREKEARFPAPVLNRNKGRGREGPTVQKMNLMGWVEEEFKKNNKNEFKLVTF